MNYDLSIIPLLRDGETLGEDDPLTLKALVVDAVECTHLGQRAQNGQPTGPESSKSLIARNRLLDRIEEEEVITLSTEERALVELCVTSHYQGRTVLTVLRYLDKAAEAASAAAASAEE